MTTRTKTPPTEETLRAEFWRLQDAMEALPQAEAEGRRGERLHLQQDEVLLRLQKLLGKRSDWCPMYRDSREQERRF